MSREELYSKSRFVVIGMLMLVISLIFLFYMGCSLLDTTQKLFLSSTSCL